MHRYSTNAFPHAPLPYVHACREPLHFRSSLAQGFSIPRLVAIAPRVDAEPLKDQQLWGGAALSGCAPAAFAGGQHQDAHAVHLDKAPAFIHLRRFLMAAASTATLLLAMALPKPAYADRAAWDTAPLLQRTQVSSPAYTVARVGEHHFPS